VAGRPKTPAKRTSFFGRADPKSAEPLSAFLAREGLLSAEPKELRPVSEHVRTPRPSRKPPKGLAKQKASAVKRAFMRGGPEEPTTEEKRALEQKAPKRKPGAVQKAIQKPGPKAKAKAAPKGAAKSKAGGQRQPTIAELWRQRTAYQPVEDPRLDISDPDRYLNMVDSSGRPIQRLHYVDWADIPPRKNPTSTDKWAVAAYGKIRRLNKKNDPIMPYAPFSREVRGTNRLMSARAPFKKWTKGAINMLRAAVENNLMRKIANGYKVAVHDKRMTLMPGDIAIAKSIMNERVDQRYTPSIEDGFMGTDEEYQRLMASLDVE